MEKLGRKSRFSFSGFSTGGEKIAFFKDIKAGRKWHEDLWVASTDGSQAKALIESHKQGSPFYRLNFSGNCLLSSDGKRIAFVTVSRPGRITRNPSTIWWMNTDGTGLKSHTLNLPPYKSLKLLAWQAAGNSLILLLEETTTAFKSVFKILRVDLEKGDYQVLIENVRSEYKISVSADQDSLALSFGEQLEKKEILAVLNLKTLEIKEVFKAGSLKLGSFKWSQDGEKIAFRRPNELWFYSLAEGKAQKICGYEVGFDWLLDGKRMALVTLDYGEHYLSILGENFKEEKRVKTPFSIEGPVYVWGMDNKVLVKFQKGPLLRLDLEKEEWKKVY